MAAKKSPRLESGCSSASPELGTPCGSVYASKSICVNKGILRDRDGLLACSMLGPTDGPMYGSAKDLRPRALDEIREAGLEKHERGLIGPPGTSVRVRDLARPVLNFCASNYLGL